MDTDDLVPECHPQENGPPTFKIVGDNIDKHVKPRDMRQDHQSQSLNHFHAYAVQDRINLTSFSSAYPDKTQFYNVDVQELLPSTDDRENILDNFCILIARCLQKYMPVLKQLTKKSLEKHIKHEYYDEMSKKSKVVSIIYAHTPSQE